mmetsp:Transcript_50035/g.161936  ORF Transcript_50035/g.161936 Transcript_50035/m.161936 type:complete len:217 (-) Transcript_50035:1992-2642(-)
MQAASCHCVQSTLCTLDDDAPNGHLARLRHRNHLPRRVGRQPHFVLRDLYIELGRLGPLGPLGAGAGVDARRGREVQGRLGRRRYYRPGCGCRRRCHGNVAWREIQGKRHFEGQYFGGHDELDSRVLRWCPQVVERVDLDSAGIGRGFRSGRGGSGGRLGGRRLKARWLGRCCPAPVCRGGLGWRCRRACRRRLGRRQQLERDRRVLRTRRLLGAA